MSPTSHLSETVLGDLVRRAVSKTQAFPCLLHLGLCLECQQRLEALYGARGRDFLKRALPGREGCGSSPLDWLAPQTRPEDYDETVRRAIASASKVERQVLEEETSAARLYRKLAGQPAARWGLVVRNQRRYQTLGMMTLVLREAKREWRRDPARAEALAQVALEIHSRLSPTVYGARLLRDREALAWGYLACSQRAQGRLPEADRALRQGELRLPEQAREALDETAWLRLFRASLDRDRRRFDSALAAARGARRLFHRLGDRPHTAWSEVLIAEVLAEQGRADEAASGLESFLSKASPLEVGEPVYFAAVQHLTTTLAQLGRGAEARRWMTRLEEVSAVFPEPVNQARLRWTEALVYQALGELERAAELLQQVQRAFTELEVAYDAALVSLDLATLLLELGRSGEARRLAEEMMPVFQSVQVEREALAAVLLFVESLRREQATSTAARAAALRLRNARRLPTGR